MSVAAWIMFILFFAWSFMGMPIGHAMIASGIVYLFMTNQDIGLVASQKSERALWKFRPSRSPAFHTCRGDHERGKDDRSARLGSPMYSSGG